MSKILSYEIRLIPYTGSWWIMAHKPPPKSSQVWYFFWENLILLWGCTLLYTPQNRLGYFIELWFFAVGSIKLRNTTKIQFLFFIINLIIIWKIKIIVTNSTTPVGMFTERVWLGHKPDLGSKTKRSSQRWPFLRFSAS